MNWGLQNGTKVHKVKARKNWTLVIISDPTKHGLTLRIPKWTRFPVFVLLLALTLTVMYMLGHIANLEQQLAAKQSDVQANNYLLLSKTYAIEDLEEKNEAKKDQLETLAVLTLQLKDKLSELEAYKNELDAKLGTSPKTTDTIPSKLMTTDQTLSSIRLANNSPVINDLSLTEASDLVITGDFEVDVENIIDEIDNALGKIEAEKDDLAAREEQIDTIMAYWDAYPSILPVVNTMVTSPYGYRRNPFGYGYEFHSGVDLKARYVDVLATGGGVVTYSGYNNGYGYLIIIDHGYGLMTKYGHNSKLYVKEGDLVSRGDVIARSGNSGRSSGPHVHYEVLLNGETQNPMEYVYDED